MPTTSTNQRPGEGTPKPASRRDVYAGFALVLIGVGAAYDGTRHTMGTLMQMGPGYFPTVLGIILVLLGIILALNGALHQGGAASPEVGEEVHPPDLRGMTAIVAGIVTFIAVGAYFGLAPATFSLVFISALGDRSATVRSALVLAVVMTLVATVVFWYLLGVPFEIVKW